MTTSSHDDDMLTRGGMDWSKFTNPGAIETPTGLYIGGLVARPTAFASGQERWFAGTVTGECIARDNRYSGLVAVEDVAIEASALALADWGWRITHRDAIDGALSESVVRPVEAASVAFTVGAAQVIHGGRGGSLGVLDFGDQSERELQLVATALAHAQVAPPEEVERGSTTSRVWVTCDGEAVRFGWQTQQSGRAYVSRIALPLPNTAWTADEFARDVTFHPWEEDPDPFPNVARTFSGLDIRIEDREAQILDRTSATLVARIPTADPILTACTDATGRTVAVGYESLLEIRDLHGGNVLRSLRIDAPASTSDPRYSRELAITPGGTFAACLDVTEFDYYLTVFGPGSDLPLWSIDMQPLMAIWGYSTMNPLLQLGGFVFGGSHLLVYFTEEPVLIPADVDAWAREVAFPPIPPDVARSLGLDD